MKFHHILGWETELAICFSGHISISSCSYSSKIVDGLQYSRL
jgi:hypothetical protein